MSARPCRDSVISRSSQSGAQCEVTVLGSMAVLNSFGAAADLMATGTVDTGPMLGPPFALDQFSEALASVRCGEGIKIQVAPGS